MVPLECAHPWHTYSKRSEWVLYQGSPHIDRLTQSHGSPCRCPLKAKDTNHVEETRSLEEGSQPEPNENQTKPREPHLACCTDPSSKCVSLFAGPPLENPTFFNQKGNSPKNPSHWTHEDTVDRQPGSLVLPLPPNRSPLQRHEHRQVGRALLRLLSEVRRAEKCKLIF